MRDRLDDLGDLGRVGHAGDAAGGADVGGNALERHDGDGTGVLGDLGLLGGDDVHDDAALEHLGQAGLDAKRADLLGVVCHAANDSFLTRSHERGWRVTMGLYRWPCSAKQAPRRCAMRRVETRSERLLQRDVGGGHEHLDPGVAGRELDGLAVRRP